MGLFGKKKEEKSCCCGDSCTPEKMAQAEAAKTTAGVKVLGSGCAKCHALEDATKAALAELNMDTTIDHVTDLSLIHIYTVIRFVLCDTVVCSLFLKADGKPQFLLCHASKGADFLYLISNCHNIPPPLPIAVSYTHLDVYKRQAGVRSRQPWFAAQGRAGAGSAGIPG